VITVGSWTYSAKPDGGLFLHLFFAFVYSYWIKLGLSKLAKLGWRAAQGLKLSSSGPPVLTSDSASEFGNRVAFSFVALLVLAGLGVLGLQIYAWLRSGAWFPFSVVDGARLIFDYQWLVSPVDWIGLHGALSQIPISALLLIGGVGLFFALLNDAD
jgi:hypothetical protein